MTDAEKIKRQKLMAVSAVIICSVVAFLVGRMTGYNKGFDKGVGWQ